MDINELGGVLPVGLEYKSSSSRTKALAYIFAKTWHSLFKCLISFVIART